MRDSFPLRRKEPNENSPQKLPLKRRTPPLFREVRLPFLSYGRDFPLGSEEDPGRKRVPLENPRVGASPLKGCTASPGSFQKRFPVKPPLKALKQIAGNPNKEDLG